MPRSLQHIDVERREDVCVVSFRTPCWDEAVLDRMGDELLALIEDEGYRKLVLNFAGVESLVSIFFGKLMVVRRRLLDRNGRLKLCDVQPFVMGEFRVLKLDQFFEFVPDRATALASW